MKEIQNEEHCKRVLAKIVFDDLKGSIKPDKKEDNTMQVTYNGFTGDLEKLEKYSCGTGRWTYALDIYDNEKKCTHLFTGVKLEDVKFSGGTAVMSGTLNIGEVSFDG